MEQTLQYGPWGLIVLIALTVIRDWLRDRFGRKSLDSKPAAEIRLTSRPGMRDLLQKLLDRILMVPGADGAVSTSVEDEPEIDLAIMAFLKLIKRHALLWEEFAKYFRRNDGT